MSRLVEEIKQSIPFSTLEEEVYLNLLRTAYHLRQNGETVLKEHGLKSQQQYNVLRILRGAGSEGLACSEIGERMIFRDSDITRLLNRLKNNGFVEIQRLESDRRVKIAKITTEGLELIADLDEPVSNRAVELLGHLGPDMLQRLNALLVLAREK